MREYDWRDFREAMFNIIERLDKLMEKFDYFIVDDVLIEEHSHKWFKELCYTEAKLKWWINWFERNFSKFWKKGDKG